jgi:hypothetical protein
MLYDQCMRLGIPVLFGRKVVEAVEDGNGVEVVIEDGTKYAEDGCVVAVGLGS